MPKGLYPQKACVRGFETDTGWEGEGEGGFRLRSDERRRRGEGGLNRQHALLHRVRVVGLRRQQLERRRVQPVLSSEGRRERSAPFLARLGAARLRVAENVRHRLVGSVGGPAELVHVALELVASALSVALTDSDVAEARRQELLVELHVLRSLHLALPGEQDGAVVAEVALEASQDAGLDAEHVLEGTADDILAAHDVAVLAEHAEQEQAGLDVRRAVQRVADDGSEVVRGVVAADGQGLLEDELGPEARVRLLDDSGLERDAARFECIDGREQDNPVLRDAVALRHGGDDIAASVVDADEAGRLAVRIVERRRLGVWEACSEVAQALSILELGSGFVQFLWHGVRVSCSCLQTVVCSQGI